MERKSFVFYKDWDDAIKGLPNDIRLELYDAIMEYAFIGKVEGLKPMVNIAFNFIKTSMDRDAEKYLSVIERNKNNGAKGGRPKNGNPQNPSKPSGLSNNPKKPKKADNDNDNVNDNKDNTPNGVSKKDAAKAATLKRKDEFGKTLVPFMEKYGKEMIRAFFNYWSELNKSETKMRYEMQKTWEIGKRLATWASREHPTYKGSDTGVVLHDNSQSKYDEKLW